MSNIAYSIYMWDIFKSSH